MCGAKEVYCRQSHCVQPVGWYIIEPCDAFTTANSATLQAFDSVAWSLNWNTTICGCSVPRVLRRQRCRYRTCSKCVCIAMKSTFKIMQEWAESAKEYPAWWTQGKGDYLLFRRTKMRLKSDYELSQSKNDKQRTIRLQKNFVTTSSRQYGITDILSDIAEAADSMQLPSESFIDDYLNIPNWALYQIPEATRGDKGGNRVEDESMTAQELQVPAVIDFHPETPNTASEISTILYVDYHPDAVPQNAFGPPPPVSTVQEYCDKEEYTHQLSRLQGEALPQTSGVQQAEFDFNDPFWRICLRQVMIPR